MIYQTRAIIVSADSEKTGGLFGLSAIPDVE